MRYVQNEEYDGEDGDDVAGHVYVFGDNVRLFLWRQQIRRFGYCAWD